MKIRAFGIDQALLQLRTLGYKDGERVWIRLIAGKGFDVQEDKLYPFDGYLALTEERFSFTRLYPQSQGGNEKFTKLDGYSYLLEQNQRGYGVYLVVNAGGRKDLEIDRCPALFYECDRLTKDEQWRKINDFPCSPSLVVDTRNSLHTYYRTFEEQVEGWRRLQQRLIQQLDSDPAIHNEARLMRLAGFYHQKRGLEPYPVTIQINNANVYSRQQFDELLPSWDESRWSDVKKQVLPEELERRLEQANYRRQQWFDSPQEFPLEICLSKDDRALIANGVGEGDRNRLGYKLAANLLGTADWLSRVGYRYHGEPEMLFDEYCDRCTPPLSHRERDLIWRSASRSNPTPSLPDEAIETCIKAWQWEQLPSSQKQRLKRNHHAPDQKEYEQYIQWEQEREAVENAIASESFLEWLKRKALRLPKSWKRGFGHKRQFENAIVPLPEIIDYDPDAPLPSPKDYESKPAPQFRFKKGERLKLIVALKKVGWRFILDKSATGAGKSHDAGLLQLESGTVWYLDINHRNSSTKSVEENYVDLNPRHEGLFEDERDGKIKRDPNVGQLVKESNCHLANLFNTVRSKGYETDRKEDGDVNPICANCVHHKIRLDVDSERVSQCAASRGLGFGFRSERAQTLAQPRIRAHPDSLPEPTEYNYSGDVCFVEEADRTLAGTKTIEAGKADFDGWVATLSLNAPDLFERLKPLFERLRSYWEGTVDNLTSDQKRFGFNHQSLMAILGQAPDDLQDIISQLQELIPNVADCIEQPDNIPSMGRKWRDAVSFARSYLRREAAANTFENFRNLPANWLVPLLQIWGGERGALRLCHRKLVITCHDARTAEILQQMSLVVALSATDDRLTLAAKLGIDSNQVVTIAQKALPLSNLKVVAVEMAGLGSGDWSDTAIARVKALKEKLQGIQNNIAFYATKRYAEELNINQWWFSHNRGENADIGRAAIAAFGTPYANVGALEDEYRALFGSLDGFDQFYDGSVQNEIIQLCGRQRPHLSPNQTFEVFLVGNYPPESLNFLRELGVQIEYINAFDLCPNAGTETQFTQWKLLESIRQFIQAGKRKLSQAAIAQLLGCSQQNVSQHLKAMGVTLTQIRESIEARLKNHKSPYKDPNRVTCENNSQNWLKDPMWRSWLGLDCWQTIEQVLSPIQTIGWQEFRRNFLDLFPDAIAVQICASLLPLILVDGYFCLETAEN
jgi:predicted XRE-type DNA-binding protein